MTAQPVVNDVAGPDQQSSASKVVALLATLLRSGEDTVSLTEVAVAVGQPKSTTHRLLKVLETQGFVDRAGSRYRLGAAFLDLAETARWSQHTSLRDAAYPALAALFERSDAVAVHLGVMREQSVQYVDKLMRPQGVRLPTRVGGRFPVACTGLGKAMLAVGPREVLQQVLVSPLPRATPHSVTSQAQLLAQLRRVRDDGFAIEKEEACHGFVCIASPVLSEGQPVAAVSVAVTSLQIVRSGQGRLTALGRLVSEAAHEVETALQPEGARHGVPTVGTADSSRGRPRIDSSTSSPMTSQEKSVGH